MDATTAQRDLELVNDVLRRTSQRIDAHAFHCVHWGLIVLIWYPLANWFGLNGQMQLYIAVSVVAVLLGAVLSIARGIKTGKDPRLPGGNTFISAQIGWICFASLMAGFVLSFVAPAKGFIDGPSVPIIWGLVYANMAFMIGVAYSRDFMISGTVIFLGCLLAIWFPEYNGFILGPFMGLGVIVPGLRAEARVRRLRQEDPMVAND